MVLEKVYDELMARIDEVTLQNERDDTGIDQLREDVDQNTSDIDDNLNDPTIAKKTVSGATLTITDAAPIKAENVTVSIQPIQSGSGDPSPENIRPISGLTSVDVSVTDDNNDTTTVTTPLGRTVYGGTLDVISGLLTVNRAIVDLSSLKWTTSTTVNPNGRYFFATISTPFISWSDVSSDTTSAMCNALSIGTGIISSSPINTFWWNDAGTDFRVIWGDVNTATLSDFEEFLSVNSVIICGKLASPTTVQLTPAQVQMIADECNISTNAASVSLTYWLDNNYGLIVGKIQEVAASLQTQINALDTRVAALEND